MQIGKRNAPLTVRPDAFHSGVQRNQGLREITVVGRNAIVAYAEDGMLAVYPVEGRASGAGLALIAGPGRLAEVFAPRALQDVSGEARHVADLLACGQGQRLCDDRII